MFKPKDKVKDKKPKKKPRHKEDPEEDEPGIFRMSQAKNNGPFTYSELLVVARSKAEAIATHPESYWGDSFTYRRNELERNEEWRDNGNRGPAPAWFLGGDDSWCHGAFVNVKWISHYKPPVGEKPEYGIITSSRR